MDTVRAEGGSVTVSCRLLVVLAKKNAPVDRGRDLNGDYRLQFLPPCTRHEADTRLRLISWRQGPHHEAQKSR